MVSNAKQTIKDILVYCKILDVWHFFRIIIGFLIFMIFHKSCHFAYQSLVSLFCSTQGKSNRFFHKIITYLNPPYKLEYPLSGALGTYTHEDVRNIAQIIERDGYYIFPNRLSEETCDALLNFALDTKCYPRPMNSSNEKQEKTKIDRKNPITIRYDFLPEELIENEEVQKLLADFSLIAVAQEYLKCKPKSDVLGMWWHTAFSKKENSASATMYHFDMDRIKWLKFFFYLTDTTKETGAHQFIKGSHNGNIPKKFLKLGYARLDTNEVLKYYGKENEITFEAPRGTVIAEDTSGLHRGNPLEKDDRLLFQIQFSDSTFGGTYTKPLLRPMSSKLRKSIEEFPKIYSGFFDLL